jgi:hypothetical protein
MHKCFGSGSASGTSPNPNRTYSNLNRRSGSRFREIPRTGPTVRLAVQPKMAKNRTEPNFYNTLHTGNGHLAWHLALPCLARSYGRSELHIVMGMFGSVGSRRGSDRFVTKLNSTKAAVVALILASSNRSCLRSWQFGAVGIRILPCLNSAHVHSHSATLPLNSPFVLAAPTYHSLQFLCEIERINTLVQRSTTQVLIRSPTPVPRNITIANSLLLPCPG